MEHPVARGALAGGCTRLSASERNIRRQRLIVYRPSTENQSSPAPRGPEEKAPPLCWLPRGRAGSPQARRQSERLQGRRQRLQQGVPQWGQGAELWLVASPMERARHRVLAIALEECLATKGGAMSPKGAHPPQLIWTPPPSLDTPFLGKPCCQLGALRLVQIGPLGSRSPPWTAIWQPPAFLLLRLPPPICSLLRPRATVPNLRHWGIAPLFQSVKSKLETFADIFLSPAKPRLRPPPSPCPDEGEESERPSQQGAHSSRQGVNIEVKIAISEPAERRGPGEAKDDGDGDSIVSRRPPICQWRLSPEDPSQPRLGRSYSCPDFPWAMPSPLPASAPCPPRRRRHTVCSLEVSRELLRGHPSPPVLPCLRKEVFPFPSPASRHLLSPVVCMTRCDEAHSSCPGPPHHEEPATALLCPRDGSQCPEQGDRGHGITTGGILLSHTDAKCSQEETTGKVSRFRIRKTPAKQQANLTPMGLPRPVRLNKKEFSLEEIYTNKNYRTPTEKRTFETIFEEPRERNGALVLTSQRKLKRTMEFQDSSLPRKQRRARPRGRLAGRAPGGRRAPPQHPNLEELLHQRLAELDALFEADGD
ncbi:unnamed protein product [Lepidochelys kempii]